MTPNLTPTRAPALGTPGGQSELQLLPIHQDIASDRSLDGRPEFTLALVTARSGGAAAKWVQGVGLGRPPGSGSCAAGA